MVVEIRANSERGKEITKQIKEDLESGDWDPIDRAVTSGGFPFQSFRDSKPELHHQFTPAQFRDNCKSQVRKMLDGQGDATDEAADVGLGPRPRGNRDGKLARSLFVSSSDHGHH